MMSREEQIKAFLEKVSEGVHKLIQDYAKEYDVERDYIFAITTGVYNDESEEDDLIMSMTLDVEDEFEFNSLIEGSLQVYKEINRQQNGESSIDWWINKYGNGSVN